MTAKFSHSGNDDFEVLKLKDFQNPYTTNSRTFKARFYLKGLSESWKSA